MTFSGRSQSPESATDIFRTPAKVELVKQPFMLDCLGDADIIVHSLSKYLVGLGSLGLVVETSEEVLCDT